MGDAPLDVPSVCLPQVLPPEPKDQSEARLWLEERRAKRKNSKIESITIDSSLYAPIGDSSRESILQLPVEVTSPVTSGTRKEGTGEDTDSHLRNWLQNRRSSKQATDTADAVLEQLGLYSPISSTDKKTDSNQDSPNIMTKSSEAFGIFKQKAPPNINNPTNSYMDTLRRTSLANPVVVPARASNDTINRTTANVTRPRSFYREYMESQKKKEELDIQQVKEKKEKEEALKVAEDAAKKQFDEAAIKVRQTSLGMSCGDDLEVIFEDENDSEEEEEFNTGAAIAAMKRMQELHNDQRNNTHKVSSMKVNGKRKSEARKNSEARNASLEIMMSMSGGSNDNSAKSVESRRNSKSKNVVNCFTPNEPNKRPSKPHISPARSKRTVMKRFNEGKEGLQKVLTEKELAAKEALEKRLAERNKHAADVAAKRRASEKGWK